MGKNTLSKKRFRREKGAKTLFSLSGLACIGILLLMVGFLIQQILPLFFRAKIQSHTSFPFQGKAILAVLSEYGTLGFVLLPHGTGEVWDVKHQKKIRDVELGVPVKKAWYKNNYLFLATPEEILLIHLSFPVDAKTGLEKDVDLSKPERFPIESLPQDVALWEEEGVWRLIFTYPDRVKVVERKEADSLFGEGEMIEEEKTWKGFHNVQFSGFYADGTLLLASSSGKVTQISPEGEVLRSFQGPSPLTAFSLLIGNRGILLGGKRGEIEVWSLAQGKFYHIHTLPSMEAAVKAFIVSHRDRSFFAWDTSGKVHLYYSTTEALRLVFSTDPDACFAGNPKGDMLWALGNHSALFTLSNPFPEVTLSSLFGKVWYEGFPQPTYAWQSTGGSNAFEPKLSLIPLIVGTLKGTFYALLFSLPLSILGALFFNQFLHPSWQRFLKPIVELMAGLPSVILGFLGGLWLAPILGNVLPGVLLFLILFPLCFYFVVPFMEKRFFPNREVFKGEVLLFLPLTFLLVAGCLSLSHFLERAFFHGSFSHFIYQTFHIPYDQRNALVVGFVMGFAVIPIIFSLAEDAFTSVSKGYVAGSLALGLSRWQTATGVVWKAALPGIFSAVMLGLGRAVGETMIVLMATGNTPILSFSPFNGFRTISANIAVELPEAPHGGTLYRLLFLSGLLLLFFTLILNTVADLVRQYNRRRLG